MSIDVKWLQRQFPDLGNITPLNNGGFKAVFSAVHPEDGNVVLKLIKPSVAVEEIEREILAVQRVQSPRVPQILEHGQIPTPLGPSYWLREEQINGETLRACLSTGPLHKDDLLRLGLHILEALVYAEAVQIVHRDVKPENIIRDFAGNFWLLDFGIARHLQLDSLTATALPFGKATWGYAPPEQCRNIKDDIDSRADLFALGVTLYEAANGSNPFLQGASNHLEVLKRVESLRLIPLSLNFSSAAQFRDLVDAMTQKRYDQRLPTAAEALQWLQTICISESVS